MVPNDLLPLDDPRLPEELGLAMWSHIYRAERDSANGPSDGKSSVNCV